MTTPSVEIVDLTKRLATELWNLNPDYQRRLDSIRVQQYARTMQDGDWLLTNDAITVSVNGNGHIVALLNGQHRVKARMDAEGVRTRVDVQLLKVPAKNSKQVETAGGDPIHDMFLVTDTGRSRSWTDFAKMIGLPDYAVTAGLVRICEGLDRGDGIYRQVARPLGTNKMRYNWWLTANHDLVEAATTMAEHTYRKLKIGRPLIGSFIYMASRDLDPELTEEFIDRVLGKTATTGAGDPAQALADKAVKWKLSHTPTPGVIQWNTILRAWHAFLAGEELERLTWTPRNLPLTVVPGWWESE